MINESIDYEIPPFILNEDTSYVIDFLFSLHLFLITSTVAAWVYLAQTVKNESSRSGLALPSLTNFAYFTGALGVWFGIIALLRLGNMGIVGCFFPTDLVYQSSSIIQLLSLIFVGSYVAAVLPHYQGLVNLNAKGKFGFVVYFGTDTEDKKTVRRINPIWLFMFLLPAMSVLFVIVISILSGVDSVGELNDFRGSKFSCRVH